MLDYAIVGFLFVIIGLAIVAIPAREYMNRTIDGKYEEQDASFENFIFFIVLGIVLVVMGAILVTGS